MALFVSIMDRNYLHIKRIGDFRKHDHTQLYREFDINFYGYIPLTINRCILDFNSL